MSLTLKTSPLLLVAKMLIAKSLVEQTFDIHTVYDEKREKSKSYFQSPEMADDAFTYIYDSMYKLNQCDTLDKLDDYLVENGFADIDLNLVFWLQEAKAHLEE